MNCIIPFTKDIKFKTNIGEILSVSLEHEFTANNNEVLGNFIVTGDYKAHEVSVNKDHFEYVLPFSVDMSSRIDADSVDFAVEDFTYEVIDNDTLRVNIEYSINAQELPEEELFKKEDMKPDASLDDLLEEIDQGKNEPRVETNEEEREELVPDTLKEEVNETRDEVLIDESTKDTVIDSISDKDDVYVTYHIHMMQEMDTLESICLKYNTSQTILGEYNDLTTLGVGSKIVIPEIDE